MDSDGAGEARRFPTGLVAALTFLVGIVVLVLLLPGSQEEGPAPFDPDAAEGFDLAAFEEHVADRLEPVSARPVRVLRVVARRVAWRDGRGDAFLEAPSLTFTLDLAAGFAGGVLIRSGVVERPTVRLVRYESGEWNYERPLDPILNGDGRDNGRRGSATRVSLRDVAVRNAAVLVQLPDTRYAIRSLDVQLTSAELAGPGVADPLFRLASAEALLELPDTAGGTVTRAVSLEESRLRLVDGTVAFDIQRGTFGGSTFAAATGIWNPGADGLGIAAELTVESLRLADVPWLRTEVPADASGSFRARIEPLAGGRTAIALSALAVRSSGSAATGSLRAILGPGGFAIESVDLELDPLSLSLVEPFTGPLPYVGELRGTVTGTGGAIRFDVDARLATSPAAEPFTTQLTGTVAFTDVGVELRGLAAELDRAPLSALEAIAPGLPFSGPVSGTISLEGAPGTAPIRLDVRLEAGGGVITVAGVVDLRGDVASYDVEGRLVGVELRRVLAPAAPPAQVHAGFSLQGTGLDPATANAAGTINGTFTGWESEPGDTIAVVASVSSGLLDTETARLELGPVALAAAGEWRFAGGSGGAIRYDLAVESLEPLAPYLPPDAQGRRRYSQGSLRAEGTVTGTLEAPVLAGELAARDFRFGEWAAERLEGEYDVRMADGLPFAEATFTGTEIRTPTGAFQTAALTVDFTRPTFELALRADQEGGGLVQVEASGRIEEAGGREITLRTVEVDLEEQRWRLPEPARIAWTTGQAVRVEDLRLVQTESEGLLRLDGIVAPFDDADFAVEIESLPVGDLFDLLGAELRLSGDLSMEGTVRGPAESPVVDLDVALREGMFRDVAISSAQALIRYASTELGIEGAAVLGDSAHLEIEGTLPVRLALGLPPTAELVDGGSLDARFVTDDFPLATLDPGIRSVQDVTGLLRADVRLAGTPDAPELSGDLEVVDGEATIPMLDQRYTEIEGLAVLDGRELTITRMTARSGGLATIQGVATFENLTNPTLDLTATLDAFQPQGVENDEGAEATGTLRLSGTARSPVLTGRVRLDDGSVSIGPFTGGAGFSDRLVGVAESFDVMTPEDLDLPDEPSAPVRVQGLEIVAGDDMWFATQEARARLRGTLTLNTEVDDITVVGTLEGDQGTFNLRVGPVTRRFEVIAANIRFLGAPDPNPALDVTASRVVRTAEGGSVDVRARVTGTLNSPQLNLSTAEGVAVAESELLSYVLFGRPTFALGEVTTPGQAGFFQEFAAFAGVSDLLSAEIAQADIIEQLDQFQIQMRTAEEFGVANFWIVAGEEVVDDFFLTLETPLARSEYWVLGTEFRIDRQWTLELSQGPVRYLGAGSSLPQSVTNVERQWLLIIRRRWTY